MAIRPTAGKDSARLAAARLASSKLRDAFRDLGFASCEAHPSTGDIDTTVVTFDAVDARELVAFLKEHS